MKKVKEKEKQESEGSGVKCISSSETKERRETSKEPFVYIIMGSSGLGGYN